MGRSALELIGNDAKHCVVLVVADAVGHEVGLAWVHQWDPGGAIDKRSIKAGPESAGGTWIRVFESSA